jgi:hypothetical protein
MSVMVRNKERLVLILLLFSKDLYPDVTALHVTRVLWRYCMARGTCIMTLLNCTWHVYHDVTVLHVTLVSWRYSVARDTCIMTLLHCTWHFIVTLLYCTWHLCHWDSEALRLLNYFTFLSFMCTPSASWLRSVSITNNYIYIYIYVILRYSYFITGTSWAYSWLSCALSGKCTGHKIGPQFLIPIVAYRSIHSWPCVLGWWSRKTRHAMCVKFNTEACSRNHCCRGKAIITYS